MLDVHHPYPGVALVVTDKGSVLLGAPADAFKATKQYCQTHKLAFPRVLVSPPKKLVGAMPQFSPEFFLYDFLFVYGAAFKPELKDERLVYVLEADEVAAERESLRYTLLGPSRDEMKGYRDPSGRPIMSKEEIAQLSDVSDNMAIKRGGALLGVDDMITTVTFDKNGGASLLGGALELQRESETAFRVKTKGKSVVVDLSFDPPVRPFVTIPRPTQLATPQAFGVKPLGTRNGFDLTGPTTGFLFWVNGRAVLYDGPIGTRHILKEQGISYDDVDAVILSHCHEDHMGAFVELILSGHRPKVFTTEPIYRSALIKLSSCFQRPPNEVASFIDYHRVTPGKPLHELGATFNFFYTVHTIPTVGMNVSMRDSAGTLHQYQISGDTLPHDGLDKMHADGALSDAVYERMRHLIPDQRVANAMFFSDVGEAMIHGHPKDWQNNPNDVYYYHCPDNEHTRGFGKPLAGPGHVYTAIEAQRLHPSIPGRLLKAMRFLNLEDPGWFATFLYQGRMRQAAAGDTLAEPGQEGRNTFSIIVSGTAQVVSGPEHTWQLEPGDFFGAVELVDDTGRRTAVIRAETPLELFEVPGSVFHEYVDTHGLQNAIERIWKQRDAVRSAGLFRRLSLAAKNILAEHASEESYKGGEVIFERGKKGDDFFLLIKGEVELEDQRGKKWVVSAKQADNFFGERSAIYPSRPRHLTAKAVKSAKTLRIDGQTMRRLFEEDMAIRYALVLSMDARG